MAKINKVKKALIEGNFLRKIAKTLLFSLDTSLGYRYRRKYTKKVPVVNNQVFFYTFQGTYTCNPKYISQELERRNADVKIVWGLTNPRSLPGSNRNSKNVGLKLNTLEYFQEAMASKVIVTNSTCGYKRYLLPLKKDQVLIETWHGSLGIKRFGKKSYKSSKDFPKAMVKTAKMTDYIISNSTFEDAVYRDTFWPKGAEILRYGHARNDIFFNNSELSKKIFNKIVNEFGLPKDKEIHFVMYGPTFRDDHNFDVYDLNFMNTLKALEKRFGGEWYMLLRYHPSNVKEEYLKNKIKSDRVLNVSDYADMQELMLISDAGISDYSSWMFDYMLRRKPVFVYARDYDKYKDERGFYYSLSKTPFPIADNNDQIVKNIESFDNEKYIEEVEEFLKDKGCMEDGQASKRIVDLILKIIEEGKKKPAK